ncbi:MAG TPA: YwqG family protein [Ktedonobacteraceae bacterium]|nr:YwqG family protein [Ktedonobacteraceae bacterium]
MDKTDLQAAFVAAGLSRLIKDIDRLARPSIRITAEEVDESLMYVGASKLGGVPDLPAGAAWPEWKGLPQSFIAQIRLDDVSQYDTEKVLPQSGMLWFFYDAQQQTFGEDPADRGGWQVLYSDGDLNALKRASAPAALPATSQFHACLLSFASELTLSQQPKLEIAKLDWTADEQQKYETLLSTFPNQADRATPHHRLLGNPDTIQDDMRLQCQLNSHGVSNVDDPRAKELMKGAMDWLLLLQVDTDDTIGMRWGNSGMLYYWITLADLKARHFNSTWLVLQSE